MKLYLNRQPVKMKINYNTKSFWLWCLIIYNKIFNTNFTAVTNPITSTIHGIIDIKEHDTTYEHEKIHLLQIQRVGRFKFLVMYLFYSIKCGYYNNPFEREAFDNQYNCQCIQGDTTIYNNK